MNYAIIDATGLVVNVAIYNGTDTWQAPSGCIAVLIPDDSDAWIGWSYVDGQFVPPIES